MVVVLLALAAPALQAESRVATFGGGCFWCMESPYDALAGVISTTSGYMGGTLANPSYEQVTRGGTGHVEVVQVEYDSSVIDYARLLEVYWRNVDPLTDNRQFCDAGESYRPVIFVHDPDQRAAAQASKQALINSGRFDQPIIVPIETATEFWPAEDYHQDYYLNNPVRYKYYRWNCGRDRRLAELWGED
ncbi:MAG: peptide-methionine (S)-S-oxide reductase [Gammaproteobacteria bacterium HGW-Gammaproteobacteria-8]|nr:MAG: peptide-methionine (S)-S-oxide reductase [Gammaproteobacteria bacterium HGW-Gammaproteobacteria-8]